jgi:hypothetical protein
MCMVKGNIELVDWRIIETTWNYYLKLPHSSYSLAQVVF